MATTTRPPFHADHVGSLLRPPALARARKDFVAGTIDRAALGAAEDAAVRDLVAMQRRVGLHGITDGEQRRAAWHMDFLYSLEGVSRVDEQIDVVFHSERGDTTATFTGVRIDGRLGVGETIFADAFGFLRDTVAESGADATPKLTIPSPNMLHYRAGSAAIDREVYPTDEEFFADLAGAYATEIAGLADLGVTYLQLDDTSFAYLNDPEQRAAFAARGGSAEEPHHAFIDHFNASVGGRPDSMFLSTHMCRGNYRSAWTASGSYEYVAEDLFGRLDVDEFFLEYDDERSGGFEPLRFVPPGKSVALGLVTTKSPVLEDKDTLKRRIDAASKYVPLERLSLSPQCGFSSTEEGNVLTPDEQEAKLALVVETAAEIWS
ncbi:MAG: 5-methyltetrahydropteroyltriglutamate--homocysteine S-methyltransferase [Streptosporangiaceae bacterium]